MMKTLLTILILFSLSASASAQQVKIVVMDEAAYNRLRDSIKIAAKKIVTDSLSKLATGEFVTSKNLIGAVDGVNKVFQLQEKHLPGSEAIYVAGLRMKRGVAPEGDYTITSTGKVTLSAVPKDIKGNPTRPISDYIKIY